MKLWHFILHLRLHYQLFILSGGYLLGGLIADEPLWKQYWLQFLNVHVLLFGGATAFNSYWDRDEGPVGGLRNPPAMERWMRDLSLAMQAAGLLWAATAYWAYRDLQTRTTNPVAPYLAAVAAGSTDGRSMAEHVRAAGEPERLPARLGGPYIGQQPQ
jgi:hypothetical protein